MSTSVGKVWKHPLPQGWAAPCPLDNSLKQTQIETNADKQDDTDEAVEGEESRIEATQIFRVDQTVFIDESYSHQDQTDPREQRKLKLKKSVDE